MKIENKEAPTPNGMGQITEVEYDEEKEVSKDTQNVSETEIKK